MSPRAGSPRSLPGDAKAGGDNGAYDAAAGLTSLLATLGEPRSVEATALAVAAGAVARRRVPKRRPRSARRPAPQVPMAEIFALLAALAGPGPVPGGLPVRLSASPFANFEEAHAAYVASRSRYNRGGGGDVAAASVVSVAFQSPVNGELWWAPGDALRGVAARPMARRVRTGEDAGRLHGYRGRQYTLVTRSGVGEVPTADRAADASLVQIWRVDGAGAGADTPATLPRTPVSAARTVGDDPAALRRRIAELERQLEAALRENEELRKRVPDLEPLSDSHRSLDSGELSMLGSLHRLFDRTPPESFNSEASYFGARASFASFLSRSQENSPPSDAPDSRPLDDDVLLPEEAPASDLSMYPTLFGSPSPSPRPLGPPNRKRRASV